MWKWKWSFQPRALSIFAKICWLGIAFPLSYSVTTWSGSYKSDKEARCSQCELHTVFYVSVHLLSCHLRLLTDLCGEVLLGHLLGLPALSDQFAHIHVNLVVRLETSWGNSKDVPSTKEHDLELPFTFLWASSSVSWSNFAVFKLVPFWKGFQIQNQMRTET